MIQRLTIYVLPFLKDILSAKHVSKQLLALKICFQVSQISSGAKTLSCHENLFSKLHTIPFYHDQKTVLRLEAMKTILNMSQNKDIGLLLAKDTITLPALASCASSDTEVDQLKRTALKLLMALTLLL